MAYRSRVALAALLVTFVAPGCTGPTGTAAPEPDEDIAEVEQAQVVCPDGEIVEGIDVSVWQETVDWDAVAADGIKFAIARASYGDKKDTYFDANWAGIKAAGLVRGAYQYWLPAKDPIAQAQAMVDIMGPLEPGDLPPVVDVEQTDGLGPAEITSRLQQWIDHVEAAIGKKPIIYSGKYFWQDNVKSQAFVDYPLWIPNYSLDCPDLPSGYWPDWHFFQYTSTGKVAGVSGNVDRNQWNGSLEDLFAFADGGGPKYAAKFVSQSFPYASEGSVPMVIGDEVEVSLELMNTGSEPWNDDTLLGTTEPRDRESPFAGPEWPAPNRYARVQGVVMPGETYTFTWVMHAPGKTGKFSEHMGLVQEGVAWFGDQGGPPDGQLQGIFVVGRAETTAVSFPFPVPAGRNDPATDGGGGDDGGEASSGCSTSPRETPGSGALAGLALVLVTVSLRRRRERA